MIKSVSLWHVTPAALGGEFYDPTDTILNADEALYRLVNTPSIAVDRRQYSKRDYASIQNMRRFLSRVRELVWAKGNPAVFVDGFPNVSGCIAKFHVTERMDCYIIVNGTAVFLEQGEAIPFEDEQYFSIPTFYERQKYEDDYCANPEETPGKKPLYDFLHILWEAMSTKTFSYSASDQFGNHGISYTLCITMIDAPGLISNQVDPQMKKNIRALLDTSAFSNVFQKEQWGVIRERVDNDDISDLNLKELSENLVYADNWSGVLLAGDLGKNDTCITWMMEFEIFLQSNWFLFDAYCENVVRQDMSSLELQGILNRVEFVKVKLENDISSNMEQSRHIMRNSLIQTSDINTIYSRMHGMISNRLKIKTIRDEQKKSRFAMFSDLSLLIIALLQIYGVVGELLAKEAFTKNDVTTMVVMLAIAAVCVFVMIKGRK